MLVALKLYAMKRRHLSTKDNLIASSVQRVCLDIPAIVFTIPQVHELDDVIFSTMSCIHFLCHTGIEDRHADFLLKNFKYPGDESVLLECIHERELHYYPQTAQVPR